MGVDPAQRHILLCVQVPIQLLLGAIRKKIIRATDGMVTAAQEYIRPALIYLLQQLLLTETDSIFTAPLEMAAWTRHCG